jgi:hypothetical protein
MSSISIPPTQKLDLSRSCVSECNSLPINLYTAISKTRDKTTHSIISHTVFKQQLKWQWVTTKAKSSKDTNFCRVHSACISLFKYYDLYLITVKTMKIKVTRKTTYFYFSSLLIHFTFNADNIKTIPFNILTTCTSLSSRNDKIPWYFGFKWTTLH